MRRKNVSLSRDTFAMIQHDVEHATEKYDKKEILIDTRGINGNGAKYYSKSRK